VIPTFNEKENIPILFQRLQSSLINYDYEIVVVDDSTDETPEVVKGLTNKYPVRLVRRGGRGLATAVVEGFNNAKGNILVVMDADLQHPPEKIPDLIEEVRKGADIVVGSRSIRNWSLTRKLISQAANFLAGMASSKAKLVRDRESGFFALRRKILDGVELKPVGYKILLEILILCKYNQLREVEYSFGERTAGESKLGPSVIFSYLKHITSLLWRTGKLPKLIKFCFVGFTGAGVNLGVLYSLTNIGLHYTFSGLLAIETSLLFNFFLNRWWTFRDEAASTGLVKPIVKDHLTRIGGILINFALLWALTELLGLYYILSMIIGIAFATLWNFVGNTRWVWRSRLDAS